MQLKEIKNKKIRAFYEAQNDRLDDWQEVDAIVRTVSDDVLETLDPHDNDGDGVAERGGGLYNHGEDVASLLPEDTQERRRTAEKHARWAINVGLSAVRRPSGLLSALMNRSMWLPMYFFSPPKLWLAFFRGHCHSSLPLLTVLWTCFAP